MELDEKLFDYVRTDMEREALEAIVKHGECQKADEACGKARSWSSGKLNQVRKRAAMQGYAPNHFTNGVAPGFIMGKVTIQRGPDGIERVWERQSPDEQKRLDGLREAVQAINEGVKPLAPVKSPNNVLEDLCNLYTFSDYHLGMLAWHREGGQDWDLGIAEKTLERAFAAMVAQSPRAHTAVINLQGDFLHTDGKLPVTPAHGHVLDADSRFPKIRQAAIRLIMSLCATALKTHKHVHLIVAEGNHDEESTGWLADMFAVVYANEPRMTVDDEKLPFYVFEWGQTMLGVHHGHKVKNEQMPLLFAAQFPESWGRTKRREIHCGHRHHRDEKEYNGVTVVQHPTLAARDAYAARGGWIADRAAWAMTYHKRYGAVGRVCVTPEMLREN